MLYDFSSIMTLSSYDQKYSLNISVYLGTTYFNIFDNRSKKLLLKFNISKTVLFSFLQNIQTLVSLDNDKKSYIDPLYTIKTIYIPEKKENLIQFSISIGKDMKLDKYRPYYLKIYYPLKKFNEYFKIDFPKSISNNPKYLNPCKPNLSLLYFKAIINNIFTIIIPLSLDKDSSLKRKSKYSKQTF